MLLAGAAAAVPMATYSTLISGVVGGAEVELGGQGQATASDGVAATVSTSLTPDPSVSISGGVPADSGLQVQAVVVWYFQVTGSAPNATVDIDFNDIISAPVVVQCPTYCVYTPYNATPGVSLSWGVEGSYSTELYSCEWGFGSVCDGGGAQAVSLTVPDNATYFLQIVAGAYAGGIDFGATFSASIDPTVHVTTPGVTLELSPNVGNGAPEPGAWTLMLAGAAAAGGRLRRRRAAGA